jgi:hypothetical protein
MTRLRDNLERHIRMMEDLLADRIDADRFQTEYMAMRMGVDGEPLADDLFDILQGAWSDAEVFTTFEPIDPETELDEAGLKSSIANRLRDLKAYIDKNNP